MDVTLQTHEARRLFPVPTGLRELASDISREVLRAQPNNIYDFIANYCSALLRTRDNTIAATQILGELLDRDISFAAMLEMKCLQMSDAHHAATVIQSAFRGHLARQMMKNTDIAAIKAFKEKTKKATTIIQAAFRGYRTRRSILPYDAQKLTFRSPIIDSMLQKTGCTWEDAHRAASCIQRAFRGYAFRMSFKKKSEVVINPMEVILEIISKTNHTMDEANSAAITIQRNFRGHLGREIAASKKRGVSFRVGRRTTITANKFPELGDVDMVKANSAAVVIQKMYRGFVARKWLKDHRQGSEQIRRRTEEKSDDEDDTDSN